MWVDLEFLSFKGFSYVGDIASIYSDRLNLSHLEKCEPRVQSEAKVSPGTRETYDRIWKCGKQKRAVYKQVQKHLALGWSRNGASG